MFKFTKAFVGLTAAGIAGQTLAIDPKTNPEEFLKEQGLMGADIRQVVGEIDKIIGKLSVNNTFFNNTFNVNVSQTKYDRDLDKLTPHSLIQQNSKVDVASSAH